MQLVIWVILCIKVLGTVIGCLITLIYWGYCGSFILIIAHGLSSSGLFCLANVTYEQGPDFDDMSSFFPCEIGDAIQYINLEYGAQAPKIVIL